MLDELVDGREVVVVELEDGDEERKREELLRLDEEDDDEDEVVMGKGKAALCRNSPSGSPGLL